MGGWQGPQQSRCSGQAGFRLNGPCDSGLREAWCCIQEGGGWDETNQPEPQAPTHQKHRNTVRVLHALVMGLPVSSSSSPRKALLSAELFKHRTPVSFPSGRAEHDFPVPAYWVHQARPHTQDMLPFPVSTLQQHPKHLSFSWRLKFQESS